MKTQKGQILGSYGSEDKEFSPFCVCFGPQIKLRLCFILILFIEGCRENVLCFSSQSCLVLQSGFRSENEANFGVQREVLMLPERKTSLFLLPNYFSQRLFLLGRPWLIIY